MQTLVTLFELATEQELSSALLTLDNKVNELLTDDKLRFEQYSYDENPFHTCNSNLDCILKVEDNVTIFQNKILIIRKISI